MSHGNGSNSNKIFCSKQSDPSSSSSTTKLNTETTTKPNLIPLSTSNNITSPKPYSSVKKLNLFPKRGIDQESNLLYDSNSFKRFRLNYDNLSDSFQNEPSTSRLSQLSTPSSASSVALGFLTDFKKFPPVAGLSGRDSPSSTLHNLNLSNDPISHRKSGSYFYSGKTTFGGANLRKNIHRLNTTPYSPYSKINVKCIEPTSKQLNKPTNSANLHEDLPLGSVTQRILDRLDKAAIPIQDAKSRISILMNSTKKFEKSRLFDTPNPSVGNNGRCNIDMGFKPMKYVLTTATDNKHQANDDNNNDKSIDHDIQKLNQIKKAEKELSAQQETKKSFDSNFLSKNRDFTSSSGKITLRDMKKGRKIEDILEQDDGHLESLANVQPLTNITLKPFTFKTLQQSEKLNFNKNNKISDKNFDTICDNSTNESLFKFSSPKLVASLSLTVSPTIKNIDFSSPIKVLSPTDNAKEPCDIQCSQQSISKDDKSLESDELKCSTPVKSLFNLLKYKKQSNICSRSENEVDKDKCVACEEPNPNCEKSQNDSKTTPTLSNLSKISQNTPLSSSLPSLDQLFKKDINKSWTCSTCSVSNNNDEKVCVSCEEPNPNKKLATQKDAKNMPKVAFGSTLAINTTTEQEKPSLSQLFKKNKEQEKKWTCPTCMVQNDQNESKCVSCEEPNPNKEQQSKTEIKPTTTFGFKFGAFKNSKIISNNDKKDNVETKIVQSTDSWQCFYCKATNQDLSKNICGDCQKIKVIAATKDQVHKFYETQTFKFGCLNDNAKSITLDENISKANSKIGELVEISTSVQQQKTIETTDSLNKNISDTPNVDSQSSKKSNETEQIEFKFGDKSSSAINLKPISSFQFGSSGSNVTSFTSSSDLKSTIVSTKSDSTNESNLFAFGSKTTSSLVTLNTSTTTSTNQTVPLSISNTFNAEQSNNQDSELKTILDKNSNETVSSSLTPKIVQTSEENLKIPSSNMFVFGSKPTNISPTNDLTNKTSFNFNPSNIPTDSPQTSLKVSNLFNFGEETKSISISTTLPSFSLATSKEPMPSTTSLFTFGGLSTVAVSTTSSISTSTTSTSSTFGKTFNFGSPVVVPKIDPGPPIPKINISFPTQPASTNATSSIFDFGSNKSNPTANTEIKFNFGASSNVTLNASNPVFGSSSVPSSFNFMGTNNNASSNSLFTFGAKPNEQSSIPKPQTGFNFNTPNNTITFGSGTNNTNPTLVQPQPSQPVMPSFNASAINTQPQALPSNQSLFKFGPESSNLNFQSFLNTTTDKNTFVEGQEPSSSLFQFSANQTQLSGAANMDRKRTIKKAKRRLGNIKQ